MVRHRKMDIGARMAEESASLRRIGVSGLDDTGWRKQRAADILGIDRVTLYRMLKKHRISQDEGPRSKNI